MPQFGNDQHGAPRQLARCTRCVRGYSLRTDVVVAPPAAVAEALKSGMQAMARIAEAAAREIQQRHSVETDTQPTGGRMSDQTVTLILHHHDASELEAACRGQAKNYARRADQAAKEKCSAESPDASDRADKAIAYNRARALRLAELADLVKRRTDPAPEKTVPAKFALQDGEKPKAEEQETGGGS